MMRVLTSSTMAPATIKDTLDRLPGGLLITDRESQVLYASSALERRTGFAVAEIVGKKPGQLWGGKMRKTFYHSLWQTIGESRAFVGEVKNRRKNGAERDEHIFILPIKDADGAIQYYAEVHPELSGRESELAFGREFLARTADMAQGRDLLSWMLQSLRQKPDGTFAGADQSFTIALGEHVQDIAGFFRESLVLPMEKVFARRKDDALLIARAQANPERFAELYGKYVTAIREYFSRRLQGDGPLSDDLTQEVFVRAFRSLPGFHMANASYHTYLLRIAHNVLVNYYRQARHDTVPLYGGEEQAGTFLMPEDVPERTLDALLTRLTETERATMLWKYRDGLKVKDIAKRVGKSENAVKLILSRTRKKMKKGLS